MSGTWSGQIDSTKSPRFAGITTFARLPYSKDLSNVDITFVGIPFDDATTFRSGARFGPKAVREGSLLLRPYNPVLRVRPFDEAKVIDYGDVDVVPGYIEETYQQVEIEISRIVETGARVVVCGGDHSVTLPVIRALAKAFGKLKLVHFDAHADCWKAHFGKDYGHGTVFRRAIEEGLLDDHRSVHVGIRGSLYSEEDLKEVEGLGHKMITMEEVLAKGLEEVVSDVIKLASGTGPVYVSFDIDACDPSVAPGTGTPEVGGFTSREALRLVRSLAGLRIVGFDLVEVSPPYDCANITAILAANLIYEAISAMVISKTRGK